MELSFTMYIFTVLMYVFLIILHWPRPGAVVCVSPDRVAWRQASNTPVQDPVYSPNEHWFHRDYTPVISRGSHSMCIYRLSTQELRYTSSQNLLPGLVPEKPICLYHLEPTQPTTRFRSATNRSRSKRFRRNKNRSVRNNGRE